MIAAGILCMAFGPSVFLLMPIYVGVLQGTMQLSEGDLGLLASSDLIGIAVASFCAPWWINRVPWRVCAAASYSGLIACNLASLSLTDFAALFALRLLAGLLTGMMSAVIMGLFSHSGYPDRVAALMVIAQVSYQSIAFLVLPSLIASHGLPAFMLPVVAVQLIALCSVAFFPKRPIFDIESGTTSTAARPSAQWPSIFILGSMAAFFAGQASLWAFIELIGNGFGLSDTEVGYALAASTFIALSGPIWGAWAGDRFGRFRPILIAGIMQITVLALMEAATTVWLYAFMLSIFQMFWTLAIGYQYGALVEADHSNRFVAIVPAAQCVGIALGPILGGMALENMGNAGVYLVSACSLLLYLLLIVPFISKKLYPRWNAQSR
jgi:predicted MFS family arabinose efflux permease